MKSHTKIAFYCLSFLGFYACSNEKNFPNTPHLEVRDFTEQFVVEGSDVEKIAIWTLGFTDGDGDIGVRENKNDPDNFLVTIFFIEDGITNEREGQSFRIPVVKNIRTDKGIEGSFEFKIETELFAADTSITADSLIYQGYVVDRSGNESNIVSTPIFSAF